MGISDKLRNQIDRHNAAAMYPDLAKSLMKFPFPIIDIVAFVVIGMLMDLWHPTWIITLLIPAYYMFAASCNAHSKKAFLLLQPIPIVILIVFLIIGFSCGTWAKDWLLWLILPIYYWWAAFYVKNK